MISDPGDHSSEFLILGEGGKVHRNLTCGDPPLGPRKEGVTESLRLTLSSWLTASKEKAPVARVPSNPCGASYAGIKAPRFHDSSSKRDMSGKLLRDKMTLLSSLTS